MALPRVIAIDGPASSGKSSVAYQLAERFEYLFVDTGVFYRVMTLIALQSGIPFEDSNRLIDLTQQAHIEIFPQHKSPEAPYRVHANGEDVTEKIRGKKVESHVSTLAAIAGVRQALLTKQKQAAEQGKVIMVGRDIGTVVLPNADIKFYLDASLDERARRRQLQLEDQGHTVDGESLKASLGKRDAVDSERDVSPLRKADDAHYINTDNKTIDEVVDQIAGYLLAWQPAIY